MSDIVINIGHAFNPSTNFSKKSTVNEAAEKYRFQIDV